MLTEHLRAILADKVQVPSDPGHVLLKEPSIQTVEVNKLVTDTLVVRLKKRFGRFSGVKDGFWNQSCDYMLVFRIDQKDRVLFVELKKTFSNEQIKAFSQLRRSLPLLRYLESVCKINFGRDTESREIEVKYVVISEKVNPRFDKQPVRPSQLLYSDDHEDITVTIFVGSRFGFRRLWNAQ